MRGEGSLGGVESSGEEGVRDTCLQMWQVSFVTSHLLASGKGTPILHWPQALKPHPMDWAEAPRSSPINSDNAREIHIYPTTTNPSNIYEAPTMSQLLKMTVKKKDRGGWEGQGIVSDNTNRVRVKGNG